MKPIYAFGPHATQLLLALASSLLIFIASPSPANEIYSVDLQPDGSLVPPGDIVRVSAILDSGVLNASLEIRAYRLERDDATPPDEPGNPVAIKASDAESSDPKTDHFMITNNLRINGNSVEAVAFSDDGSPPDQESVIYFERDIVVPYSSLLMNEGAYDIIYEVRLNVDNKVIQQTLTRITRLTVTGDDRTEMVLGRPAMQAQEVITEGTVNYWNDDQKALVEEGRLNKSVRTVETRVFEKAKVKIPGGFLRDEVKGDRQVLISSSASGGEKIVYFATNRAVAKKGRDISAYFSDKSVDALDEMTFGYCLVSIPIANHLPGRVERPGRWWFYWTETQDPKKHFVIEKFDPGMRFSDIIKADHGKDMFVFVHGYNNTFESSVFRAAQIQHDIKFAGAVLAFSWPSCGKTLVNLADPFYDQSFAVRSAYSADEEQAAMSGSFLAHLLKNLLLEKAKDKSGGKVHVLAHSMGNRVLLTAIDELNQREGDNKEMLKLGNVVLAAADIDGVSYANVRDALLRRCERVTFYFSPDDGALRLSQALHVNKPLGLSPTYDTAQMDTIDATKKTGIFNSLGHNYVMDAKPLLTDLRLLLTEGLLPKKRRPPLHRRVEDEHLIDRFFWSFR